MNYKKLLGNIALGVSALATTGDVLLGISLKEFLNDINYLNARQAVKAAVRRGDIDEAKNLLRQEGVDDIDQAVKDFEKVIFLLDPHSLQIAAQYVDSSTLFKLLQTCKKHRELADKMRLNPVSVTGNNKRIYGNIQTQQLFQIANETDLQDESRLILGDESDVAIYHIKYPIDGECLVDAIQKIYDKNNNVKCINFDEVFFKELEEIQSCMQNLKQFYSEYSKVGKKIKVKLSIDSIVLDFDDKQKSYDKDKIENISKFSKTINGFQQLFNINRIVLIEKISFNKYINLKAEQPLLFFHQVELDVSLNRDTVLKQLEMLEKDSKVLNITIKKGNEIENNSEISLLLSSGYKIQELDKILFRTEDVLDNFFCVFTSLDEDKALSALNTQYFYGINLSYFLDYDFRNIFGPVKTNDILQNSSILTFYLPFFKYDPNSLFSLFTALACIDFHGQGQTIWLPPYKNVNIDSLKQSMKTFMKKLPQRKRKSYYGDVAINKIIDKVKFYTPEQMEIIKNQHFEFYNFIVKNSLENYMKYINVGERPDGFSPIDWNKNVLPVKAEAEKLMAVMRGEQLPKGETENQIVNDGGMMDYVLISAIDVNDENESIITNSLAERGFRVQDVEGDGNCGVYSLLAGLNPNEAQNYQYVHSGSQAWKNASRFRMEVFNFSNDYSQMVSDRTDINQQNRWLDFNNPNVIQAISGHIRSQGRTSLIIIDTTLPFDSGLVFTLVDEEGNHQSYASLEEVLQNGGDNPLIIMHVVNHWKAVIPHNN